MFLPSTYEVIRDNQEMFTGVIGRAGPAREAIADFHEKWLGALIERDRAPVTALMKRLFPKVESAIGRMNYGSDFLPRWRQDLRVCSPDLFHIFFQFGVPEDHLTQAEFSNFLEISLDRSVLVETLKAAKRVARSDGRSKAGDYVDRLIQLERDDITAEQAERLIEAVFALDEDLLTATDERGGTMRIPNSWRVLSLLNHLLERIPKGKRVGLLLRCIQEGQSYSTMVNVVEYLGVAIADPSNRKDWMDGIDDATVLELKAAVVSRLDAADLHRLLTSDDAEQILLNWSSWTDPAPLRARLALAIEDDALLVVLLPKFLRTGTVQAWGDRVARTTYHIDPKNLERYFDLESLLTRIQALMPTLQADSIAKIAVETFTRGMERMRAGLPTARGVFQDED